MKNLQEFDKLKKLEAEHEIRIPSDQYIVARLDGHGFSKFTKGLKRPFDATLREAMADTTRALHKKFNATYSYTQSDEITLIWEPRMDRSGKALVEHPHSGRVVKLSSLMSSYCSIEFYKLIHHYKESSYNGFDCRVYGCDKLDAFDSLRFRMIDCATNAYQSVAQSMWSPKQLQRVSVQQIKAMLLEKGIDVWKEYGDDAMLGVYFYKEMNEELERSKIVRSNGGEMMKAIKEMNLSIDI
jgi:tRNA(His) 5'-end guanylyltransferase